jgi:hypothetical protein
MKRNTLAAMAALGAALCAGTLPSRAQDAPTSAALPLKDVVLFSSGVGYFQREGRVAGGASVDLSFRAEQINDILKSLVLIDPAGAVRPVTYNLKDAASRRLLSAGQGLNSSVSLGALLRQFQGARLRLETGAEAVEGRLISVSVKPLPVKDAGVVQTEVLNVLTETGLRAVLLDQVSQVRLLDARLDRELRESLDLLARGLDDQRQKVQLQFGGQQAREVKAGYLQETPVWKTTYRLVLEPGQTPYLQGWAIVENTTDEDWKDVRLSLVSGRPISFIQDLYQPLYVPRPIVQAQVIGSPNPQTYAEALEQAGKAADFAAKGPPPPAAPRAAAPGRAGGGGLDGFGLDTSLALERRRNAAMSMDKLAESLESQAQGSERGALFEYAIKQPLTLAKGQAAMVPIVTAPIEGEAVAIFDPRADSRRALGGFRLKNSTGLHLSGGPITVFSDGAYAGDAQITNLQPNEDRLLSYSVDLDLVADHKPAQARQQTLDVVAKAGVLWITRKLQQEQVYTLRNKSAKAKVVLVQQSVADAFKLVSPEKPFEKTADEYRFRVEVPAGQTVELKVLEERPLEEQIALLNADVNMLTAWAQNAQVSEKLRGALKTLIAHRQKIVDLQAKRAVLDAEIKAIDQEQDRIRKNMAQLDRTNPLYQQYVKKLTDQEARIEAIRGEVARLREAEAAAQLELRAFVEGLTS